MTDENESRPDISAGVNALRATQSKPIVYPAVIRFIFGCECGKMFPIEDGFAIRTVLSAEEALDLLAEFSKEIEPRTIKCSCGREAEYHQKDVGFYALE